MKKSYATVALILLVLVALMAGKNVSAQLPFGKAPGVAAALSVQPDLTGLCPGSTVTVPVHISGDNVLSLNLYLEFDHNVLARGPGAGYSNLYTNFNALYNYNYSATYPTVAFLDIQSNDLVGTNFDNDLLINLVFIYQGGSTAIHFRRAPDPTPPPVCKMFDEFGSQITPVTYTDATVSGYPNLAVGNILGNQILCAGSVPTMLMSNPPTNGTAPTYQWQSSTDNVTFTDIPGATDATYQPSSLMETTYYRQLQNATATCGGPLPTNTVTITVNPLLPVSLTIAPSANPVCQGTSVTFTATPVNGGTLPAYQWQVNGTDVPGATDATYAYVPVNNDAVSCVLTSNATCPTGSPATSNTVVMTVDAPQPVSVSILASANPVCSGFPVTFTATPVNGGATPAFQWKVNGSDVPGATNNTYNYIPAEGDAVTCELTSSDACVSGNPALSNTVTISLTPLAPVSVTIDASANPVCAGEAVFFVATPVNGGSSPVYQWKIDGDNIPGATSSQFINIPGNGDVISCSLNSSESCVSGNPAMSNLITMTVNPVETVSVSIAADANNICEGTTVTYTATPVNGGATPAFQWKVDGTIVTGATNSTYSYAPASGDLVVCEMTSAVTCPSVSPAVSNTITMVVNPVLPVSVTIVASETSVCTGDAVTFTALPVNGGTTPAYQWVVNGSNISGATNLTYAYNPANGDVVTFVLTSGEPCGTGSPATSNAITVTVDPPLAVGNIADNQAICAGEVPAELTANAPTNGTSPTYQWQSSLDNSTFGNINGATMLNYQPGALTQTTYYRQLQDALGTCGGPLPTNSVTITVNPVLPVSVSIITSARTVCAGTSVILSATPVNGGATPAFQWVVNGTNVAGATNAIYSYIPTDGDDVTCVMTSSETCTTGNPATSNTETMTVHPILPVSVSIAATATHVCAGDAVTLTATPVNGGVMPAFQWVVNGTNVSGATDVTYTYTPVNGDVVTFILTSSEPCTTGSPATSSAITLTVDPVLAVGSIAADQSICAGEIPAQLTATGPANGTSPVYQWQSSIDNSSFANINGATMLNYQPEALTTTTYYRQVQDALGTCGGPLPTNTVTITVNPVVPVSVTIAASANPVCGSIPVTFTATPVNGGTTPMYQWVVNSVNVAGATDLTYTYAPADGDVVAFVLTSGEPCGTGNPATSNPITMTVDPPLAVGSIAASQTVCTGTVPALLTGIAPSNGTNPVYQWQSSLDNSTFTNLSGATMLNYQPAALTQTTYFRQVQDALGTCGGPLPTNTVTITVEPTFVAGSISGDQIICAGNVPAQFTGIAPTGGSGAYTYQWQQSADNSIFTDIAGATNLNYQAGAVTVTTYYRQIQDGTCGGPQYTNTIVVTVNPPLTVGTIFADQTICEGTIPFMLTATAPNGTNPVYQWQSSPDNNTFNNVAGATALNYQPGALTQTTYFRQIQNATGTCDGPLPTNTVTITVTPTLEPGTISADQTLCSGVVPAQLAALAPSNGTSPTYQWQSSLDNSTFANINGATMQNYQPGALTATTYYRQMQDALGTCGGPLPTNTVTITVTPVLPVSATIIASANPVCGSVPVTFTATPVNGGVTPTYQWAVNTVNVAGATDLTYTYTPADGDMVSFVLTSSESCTSGNPATSNIITMSVEPPLAVGAIAADQTICSGAAPAPLTATAPANGTSPVYQWQSSLDNSTFANISGATMQNYQPGALTQTTYYRQVQNATGTCGGPLPTNTVTITVEPSFVVGSISGDQFICAGDVPTMITGIAPTGGSGVYTYQWQQSTDNAIFTDISGATNLNYQPGPVNVTTWFRLVQDGTCGGPQNTNTVTVTVNPPLATGTIAADQTICEGTAPVMLTGTAPNGTNPVYQWQSSLDNSTFNNIAGATALNYQPGTLTQTTYYRQVQDAAGTCGGPLPTNTVTITITPTLLPGTIAADQTICSGDIPAGLTASAPVNGNSPAYQWQSSLDNSTFANINGATMQNYQPGALTMTTYYRQLQDALGTCGGPVPTNTVTISVNPLFAVGSISASQAICPGDTPAQLNGIAPAGGSGIYTYQWQISTDNALFTDIAGATTLSYQPGAITVPTWFRLVQDGTCGGPQFTNTVAISINPPLAVGMIAADQVICEGTAPALLTGTAPNGTSPVYQWQSSLDNSTFTNISGATALNYQPGTLTNTTYYRLQQDATGVCGGPLPTNTVTISVTPTLLTGTVSASQTICTGTAPALLTATPPANGTSPAYQWQSSLDNNTFTNISGATMQNYQPGVLTTTTHYRQLQEASGTCGGPLPTNSVTITVNPDLVAGTIAADQTICANTAPAMLTGTPPNGSSPVYQWQSSLDNNTFTNISGATALNYQPGILAQTTYFRLMQDASGTCGGPLPTNVVTITTSAFPVIVPGTIAASQTICTGTAPAGLTGTAPNGTSPVYQWQSSLDNNTFTNIAGATALNYQPGALTATTYYRLMQDASSTCGGPLPTNTVTITVQPNLAVGSISANQSICAGDVPALLNGVPPSNGSSPTYQWQSSLDNNTFTNIAGATMLNYQPGAITQTTYFRQMQNAAGTCLGPLPTNVVTITFNPILIAGSISASQAICPGTTPALLNGVAPANGTSPAYQWQISLDNSNFSNIAGATSLNYQPGVINTTTYFRQLQNASGTCGGPLATNTITISMNPALIVGSIAADQSICSGTAPALLTGVAPANGTSPTYQWQSSPDNVTFTDIAGATNLNYQPGTLASTTYYRLLQNASGACGGPLPTNTVTITVNPPLSVGSIAANQAICFGAIPALLTGVPPTGSIGPYTYQWQNSPDNVTFTNISGATNLNYQPGALTATTYYRQVQSSACGTPENTNVVTITVNPLPVPTIAGPNSVCVNSTGNVYTTEAGMTGYTWTVSAGGTITTGTGTNAITVTWNTTGPQTVSVNYTNANNCTAATPTVFNVTVNPLPTPTIAGSNSVCVNSTGNVYTTETGMTGYTWTVSAGGTITAGAGTNAITVAWNTTGAQTVSVNYTNANNCTAATPTVYNVTVNPLPVPTITGPNSVCVNSTGNVYTTQTGMTGYTWTVSAGGTITAGAGTNAITVTWNTTGAQTVSVNYTNATNCTAATPTVYNVTVNPLPVPTITGPNSVCVNSTGNVYTTQTGMTGYTWTVSAGGTITAGAGTNAITVTWNTTGAQTVSVNYANANNCTAATPTVFNVTVNARPTPTITGPNSVCVNSTGNVYTTQTGMTGYTWTVSAGGTITAGAGTNAITVTWNTAGAQTVSVNYANAGGCTAATPTVYNVTVNAVPTPTITGPTSACQGATATYSTQTGMTNYVWTVSAGGTITGGGTSTDNTVTVQWNGIGAQTVTVNYTNVCPGGTPGSLAVTVNPAPVPTIGSMNNPCVGSTNNIYYTESGMTGYVWTVSAGGTIVGGQGTATLNVTWNQLGIQTVTVNYVNANGCSAAQPTVYTVFVNSPPAIANPITGTASVCAGTNGVTYTTTPVTGADTYTWSVPAGATIASGQGTTSITVNFGATAVSGNVTVAGTNQCGNGPASTFAVTVNPLPAAAGAITGPASVCAGSAGNIYTVAPIVGATSYTWTVPAGAVITSGANSNTITVTFGATPATGIITVLGSNTCGSGAVSPNFSVTVNAIPAAPVVTAVGPLLTSSVANGNQWYYEGTGAIPGATGQTYTATVTGWYWSVVTVNGCSSDTSNHVYVLFVGQEELQSSSYNVFPVPNDGKFRVSIVSPTVETYSVQVYNLLGEKMYELRDVRTEGGRFDAQIDLRPIARGIYTVVFVNGEHQVVRKMVVNK